MIAVGVAGLFAAGVSGVASAKAGEEVVCDGINSCKGTGSCAGGSHGCGGKNGCKGQGWVPTKTEKECTDKGGTIVASKK